MKHVLCKVNKRFLRLVAVFSVIAMSVSALAVPVTTFAQAKQAAQQAICQGAGNTGANCNPSGSADINKAIKLGINILSIAAGIIGVVMVIVGGLKYITSQGDASQISSAKNTVVYAVVGLVVAAMAQFIVHFVLNKAQR